jgi:hypothetical protein
MLLRSLARPEAEPVVGAWTGPLLCADPHERPTAPHAAAALARCAPQEPIRAGDAAVAAAIRAGAVERTVRHPADRWWHIERAVVRASPLVGLAVAATLSGLALVPAVAATGDHQRAPVPRVTAQAVPVSIAVSEAPEVAAVELAERRIAALAAGDGAALLAISVAGGQAASADRELASALASRSATFAGLELLDASARVVARTPGGAVVEVRSTLSDYGVGQDAVEGGSATATVELALTAQGWRVARILPPP